MGEFEVGEHPEWVIFEGSAFAQNDVFKEGEMNTKDARELVEKNLDEVIGFSWHEDYEEYRWVVRRGSAKIPGQAGWKCAVYKVKLPTADETTLFKDDFAGTGKALGALGPGEGWARPGRGEGLGDQLTDVDMIQGIDPCDIQQGTLGDCWLLSSFAAMCEFPTEVRSIVSPNTIAKDGKYTVKLMDFSQNKVVPVEVDDRIPMGQGGLPRFVKFSKDDEIWPCIFEKAVAKMAGGYPNIDGADPLFALAMLTGTESSKLREFVLNEGSWQCIQPTFGSNNPHDRDRNPYNYGKWPDGAPGSSGKQWSYVLRLLADYDQKSYLMCATTHAGSDKDTNSYGIVQGHAYTVISVECNVAGSGRDMLCLRNPWGTGEWKGDWSDESDMWKKYPEIKKALNYEFADDGIFWMEGKDFIQNYSTVEVCCKTMPKGRGKQEREDRGRRQREEAAQPKVPAPAPAEPKGEKKEDSKETKKKTKPPPPKRPLKKTKAAKDHVAEKKIAVEIPGPETITSSDGSTVTVSRPPSVSLEEWAMMKSELKDSPDSAKRMEAFSKDANSVRSWLAAKAISEHYQAKMYEKSDESLMELQYHPEFAFLFKEMQQHGAAAVVQKHWHNTPLMQKLSKAIGGVPGEVMGTIHHLKASPVTLHEACKMGDMVAVQDCMAAAEKSGANALEMLDSKGITCLAYAIGANRTGVVKLLLEKKADVKKCDAKGGTGLHYAAAYGRKELASFLVDSGVSVNAANDAGLSPLALATRNKQQDVIDILKKKGAK